LEFSEMPQVFLRRLFSRLKVRVNSPQRLGFQIRTAAIKHQDRVKRGGVKRGWDTASQGHGSCGGIVDEADVRRQGDLDEGRRILEHARDAVAEPVIAAVMNEEGIRRMSGKPLLGLFGGYGPGLATVAGQTGAPVATEGLTLEHVLAAAAARGTPRAAVVLCGVNLELGLCF
jgi:hypothetical protein